MKFILTFSLHLLALYGYSQDDLYGKTSKIKNDLCRVKIDDFTKIKSIKCDTEKIGRRKESLGPSYFLEASVESSGKSMFLYLIPQYAHIQTIEKGEKVLIMFTDNSILELTVENLSISDHTTGRAFTQGTETTIWYNILGFILSPEQAIMLSEKDLKKIRCGIYDYEVKGKWKSIIKEMIRCIWSKQ